MVVLGVGLSVGISDGLLVIVGWCWAAVSLGQVPGLGTVLVGRW